MTLVRIIKDYDWPNLLRQTPGGSGRWGDVQFTCDDVRQCDYALILNGVPRPTSVECDPDHVWNLIQEPPVDLKTVMHYGRACAMRVLTCYNNLNGPRYHHCQPALPWHVNRSYNELTAMTMPAKTRLVSCVMSQKRSMPGHRNRLKFLDAIAERVKFDHFGRGFQFVEDKWDALADYRYSIAIENFANPLYWTEKIADCYLAWTMPIYFGCTEIERFFPPESMIRIDIDHPEAAADAIKEAVASERWEKSRDAITHARDLCLNRYQLFPYIADLITQDASTSPNTRRQLCLTNSITGPGRTALCRQRVRSALHRVGLAQVGGNVTHKARSLLQKTYIDRFGSAYKKARYSVPKVKYAINLLRSEGFQSQFGQDKYVYEILLGKKNHGVFVDLGAHDGVTLSNTYALEKRFGWSGLAVEPIPSVFAKLKANRTCHLFNGCISDRHADVEFCLSTGSTEMLSGMRDTYHPSHKERVTKENANAESTVTIINVPAVPLMHLLDQYTLTSIDYLTIDTEGSEYTILSGIPFDKVDIDVIDVENPYCDERIYELLIRHGYELVAVMECDEIYRRLK